MSNIITPNGRGGRRIAPAELDDAVKLWARNNGRTGGRLEYVPAMGCWCIFLNVVPDHPLMRAYQEGRLDQAEPPTDSIPLQEWDPKARKWTPISLDELGAEYITELLDKGNLWSGRGEFESMQEAVLHAREQNERQKEAWKKYADEAAKDTMALGRRKLNNLPLISVNADIKSPPTPTLGD